MLSSVLPTLAPLDEALGLRALIAGPACPGGEIIAHTCLSWLRALHLPASVVGGLLGWCFFAAVELCGAGELADDWLSEGWDVLPSFCTNIIFSALFLGEQITQTQVAPQTSLAELHS